jgi:hypothetical protein
VLWVVLFLVLAVAALVVLVCYAVWLAHKTADVLSEVGVLADQAGQLADLLGEIGAPGTTTGPTGVEGTLLPTRTDVR